MTIDAAQLLGKSQVAAAEASALSRQLQKPFEHLEAEYLRRWRSTEPGDVLGREDAWLMLRALDELRSQLEVTAKGGQVTAFNLRRTLAAKPKRG